MPTSVHYGPMGRITVETIDKYENTNTYEFTRERGVAIPKDGYTPTVLKALWNESVPVDWSPDELTPSQRAQIDGFCDDCGNKLTHEQTGPNQFTTYCPGCDE